MKNKPTIPEKSLANAVKSGEISLKDLPKIKRKKIKNIINTNSDEELKKSSKLKHKFSKRKVKHISKNKNESMENNEKDFKKIITNIDNWEDKIKGGLAKNKKPSDFDLDSLSKGSQIQMEHTDDPEEAIDIAMDHLEEFEDYYDEEKGLPSMERKLRDDDFDDDDFDDDDDDDFDDDDDDDFDDDDDDDDDFEEDNFRKIKSFDNFNENYMPHMTYSNSDWENDNPVDDEEWVDINRDNFDNDEFDNDEFENDEFENDEFDDDRLDNDVIDDELDMDELSSDDQNFDEDDEINENSKFIKKFNSFFKTNEQNEPKEPKMYPRENKFKRTMEYTTDIEKSLIQHNFIKNEGEGDFIIFDIMEKSFEMVNEKPEDIREINLPEFDHIMDNL